MLNLIFNILDIALNTIGFAAVVGFIYVFVGLQKKMLWTKTVSLLGYQISLESHAKKQLKIEINKQV